MHHCGSKACSLALCWVQARGQLHLGSAERWAGIAPTPAPTNGCR